MMRLLRTLLLGASFYLFCVVLAHFTGIKIPGLFIYYDVDSTLYQDRIISALAFAVSVFYFGCYKISRTSLAPVPYALIAGAVIVVGLALNNYWTAADLKTNPVYWFMIGALGGYQALLFFVYTRIPK